uniref:Uncharacterized protein n=1 Tax=Palpitomonas bilix TaxID=652834 RepID=A0A7S3GCL8_9EUKA|eukprot:CAMPEP_0113916420 /NCGR_PEP_ID=MMETSP0780_2-20120614/32063_1 /TAXON_ID=652834 /ORGANISM="Palpitomonas bilix" /LENGTH=195 /DNA_ID=CAMNT_0000915669 /DNA_START=37 /DNA_END=624 /DNA_ORIENTATION=+ /assembly_acc=CAM_ASM_000599
MALADEEYAKKLAEELEEGNGTRRTRRRATPKSLAEEELSDGEESDASFQNSSSDEYEEGDDGAWEDEAPTAKKRGQGKKKENTANAAEGKPAKGRKRKAGDEKPKPQPAARGQSKRKAVAKKVAAPRAPPVPQETKPAADSNHNGVVSASPARRRPSSTSTVHSDRPIPSSLLTSCRRVGLSKKARVRSLLSSP